MRHGSDKQWDVLGATQHTCIDFAALKSVHRYQGLGCAYFAGDISPPPPPVLGGYSRGLLDANLPNHKAIHVRNLSEL